jgi:hypothetical protein
MVEIANLAEPNKRQYLCFDGEAYINPKVTASKAFRSPTDHVKFMTQDSMASSECTALTASRGFLPRGKGDADWPAKTSRYRIFPRAAR